MTVRSDLERVIAMAQSSKGSYMMFATDSEDNKAKQVFQQMAEDMDRHVQILESRIQYLDQYNQLNDGGDDQQQGNQKKGKQQKEQ